MLVMVPAMMAVMMPAVAVVIHGHHPIGTVAMPGIPRARLILYAMIRHTF